MTVAAAVGVAASAVAAVAAAVPVSWQVVLVAAGAALDSVVAADTGQTQLLTAAAGRSVIPAEWRLLCLAYSE
jgi:hypothetical protein